MKTRLKIISHLAMALVCNCAFGWAFAAEAPSAVFEGKDTLLRPVTYREWVFVGSSLGLRYSEKDTKEKSELMEFKNVYINPEAYRAFAKTGKFPDGTILVLETANGETKQEPGMRGSFQKDFTGLAAAVKDGKRFDEEWAYFSFGEGSGKLKDKARPASKSACFDCHHEKAATDNVFTQFYPVLRAVAK